MINFQNIKRDAPGYIMAYILFLPGMIMYLLNPDYYGLGSDSGFFETIYCGIGLFYCFPISCILLTILIIMCINELFFYIKRKFNLK